MLEEECEELEVATLVEVVVLGARGIVALNHGLLHAEEMIRKQSGNKVCVDCEKFCGYS